MQVEVANDHVIIDVANYLRRNTFVARFVIQASDSDLMFDEGVS